MRHLAGVMLSRDQHEALIRVCDLAGFPGTYDEWLSVVELAESELRSAGDHVRPVEVDVQAFLQWCAHVEIIPCLDALKAYAIVRRLGPTSAPSYGSTYVGELKSPD